MKQVRISPNALVALRRTVWANYRKSNRAHLPWRKTKAPYCILVSEMMLQQTQVSRVIPKYREFLKRFPSARALAEAPLTDVLRAWSGLGYNRRAKFLHNAAKEIVAIHSGKVPRLYSELVELPGVGDYTAKAVRVFAWNEQETLIETNIRTVFMYRHSNIWEWKKVSDKEIRQVAEKAAKGQNPRDWHWALMDYGAHLKASGLRINVRSKHYVKQSKFEGSLRQVRGAILKALVQKSPLEEVRTRFKDQFETALASLRKEGLVEAY